MMKEIDLRHVDAAAPSGEMPSMNPAALASALQN